MNSARDNLFNFYINLRQLLLLTETFRNSW
jgi:hypothetical protein